MKPLYYIGLPTAALIALGIIVALPGDGHQITYQDRVIEINNCESGDIIICSDRIDYAGSDTGYFSLENKSGLDQNILVSVWAGEELNNTIKELKLQQAKVEKVEECSRYGDKQIVSDNETFYNCLEKTTKDVTVYEDKELPLPRTVKSSAFEIKTKSELQPKGYFSTYLKKGEVSFYSFDFNNPIEFGQGGGVEFAIHAIGDGGVEAFLK